MPELVLHCPHCDSERTGFTFGGSHPNVSVEHFPMLVVQRWNALFVCRHCNEGVAVRLVSASEHKLAHDDLARIKGDPTKGKFQVEVVYPGPANTEAPEHVPPGVSKDYVSAAKCLRRQEFTAAGMMFRRALERATLELADNRGAIRSLVLAKRIERLADEGVLEPTMKDLAHAIRLEGNEAAHEDELDGARARQLGEFAELFLLYAFTLPARIRRVRAKTSLE